MTEMSHSDKPRALVLGSGTSTGVPLIGCHCPVCTSDDPRDSRLRSGVYVRWRGFALELDVSGDFRQQALRYGIECINALLITHSHADHVLGLDEIRRFNTIQKSRITAYARDFALAGISQTFGYIYSPTAEQEGMYRPLMDFVEIKDEPIQIGPFTVSSISLPHGPVRSTAFKLTCEGRSFVYAPDCSVVEPEFADFMCDADCVMLDGLRERYHQSHLTMAQATSALQSCNVKRGILTHIGHDVKHIDIIKQLPPNVEPAYDGMEFEW